MDGELTPDLEALPPRATRQRLIALAAAVLFAGLVTGVAVVASGGSGKPLPKLPTGSAGATAATGAAAATGATAAAPALAPYGIVRYQVQGTLPALTGSAPAYRLPTASDQAAASRLAIALGLHEKPASNGSGLSVSSGTQTLTIFDGPGVPWSFGTGSVGFGGGVVSSGAASSGTAAPPPTAVPAPTCPMPPCPPGALCAQVCQPPTTVPRPADLPTSTQAEQIARTTAAAAGFAVANADVTVMTNDYSVSVELAPRAGGLPTSGYSWVFDLGSKGAIEDARGYLAPPVKLGSYPLAGTTVGITRLQQGMGVGPRPMMGAAEPAIAYPICAPSADCPERTVTVTGVHLVLADEGGDLVPAYVFTDATGTVGVVPATTDSYLEVPATVVAPKGVPLPAPGGPMTVPAHAPVNPGGPIIVPSPVVAGSSPCASSPPPGRAAPTSCKG